MKRKILALLFGLIAIGAVACGGDDTVDEKPDRKLLIGVSDGV